MNLATIDVGTNTTLLLVARVVRPGTLEGSPPPPTTDSARPGAPARVRPRGVGLAELRPRVPTVEVLEERAEITRLGRGIGQGGALGAEGIARTLGVLREYAAAAREHGARIAAVGTEALRRAPNAAAFLEPAREILGTPVEVIDGDREAALTFRAVVASFPEEARRGPLTVVDIGGGSTEVIVSEGGALRFRTSLPLGSVRLTERHVRHDPAPPEELAAMEREVDGALAAIPFPRSAPGAAGLVGVAGTVTSLAAMALELASYDPTRVHGFALGREALDAQVARLVASTQPERERMVGLDPRRADVILAGAVILQRLAEAARAPRVLVSDRGIRWGLLHELAAADITHEAARDPGISDP